MHYITNDWEDDRIRTYDNMKNKLIEHIEANGMPRPYQPVNIGNADTLV